MKFIGTLDSCSIIVGLVTARAGAETGVRDQNNLDNTFLNSLIISILRYYVHLQIGKNLYDEKENSINT